MGPLGSFQSFTGIYANVSHECNCSGLHLKKLDATLGATLMSVRGAEWQHQHLTSNTPWSLLTGSKEVTQRSQTGCFLGWMWSKNPRWNSFQRLVIIFPRRHLWPPTLLPQCQMGKAGRTDGSLPSWLHSFFTYQVQAPLEVGFLLWPLALPQTLPLNPSRAVSGWGRCCSWF